LQEKVEDTLKKALMEADDMFQRQVDLFSLLRTLDAGITYANENAAHLTDNARVYISQLHNVRSRCMVMRVCRPYFCLCFCLTAISFDFTQYEK